MRTSKVLAGSALAIAAAMQIGVGGIASAAAGESLAVAGTAIDDKGNLLVDIVFTCAEGAKHKMLSVAVTEDAKKAEEGKEAPAPTEGTGMADIDIKMKDADGKEEVEKGCTGSEERRTVSVEPDEGMKWSKPGKGTVKVSFSDDILFRTETTGAQWVAEESTDGSGR
ncbi:hypothetical protein ACIBCN_19555 [Nocardia sp. NPDC051052]|uniref:hypothetical protein n=1 Tax=Nocardia sp. NPDC051052 TaxID=3364322 RepID=UPI0037A19E10